MKNPKRETSIITTKKTGSHISRGLSGDAQIVKFLECVQHGVDINLLM